MTEKTKKVLAQSLAKILANGIPLAEGAPEGVPETQETAPEQPVAEPKAETATREPKTELLNTESSLETYLKNELSQVKTELTQAKAVTAELEAKLAGAQAQVTSFQAEGISDLKAALTKAVGMLSVPLNTTLLGLESFSGTQLAAAYNQLHEKLHSTFKEGPTASTVVAETKEPQKAPVAPNPPTSAVRLKGK